MNFDKIIEKYENIILDAEKYIWAHPETGYKEYVTNDYVAKKFTELGYELTFANDIPGFYTVADTKKPGPEILILAELDSVLCPEHNEADKTTGAVHACGHHTQCAAILGIAAALKEPAILDKLCGKIRLCLVPAEELLEIEFRSELKKQGKIKYYGGKSEFLSRGYFDGVDLAFMMHAGDKSVVRNGMAGCIAKKIIYKGKACHASLAWEGVNALYAANCGLNAINAIRETFKESDIIRVHPIITNGGSIVNGIPETVTLESFVRGASFDAIVDANKKVNKALCGAALSLGANVEIVDIPGYSPLHNDKNLIDVVCEAGKMIGPECEFEVENTTQSGCTDLGDLSMIMPVVHPFIDGAKGVFHGNDFVIENPYMACVLSAKVQLAMLYILLSDNAKRAKKIIDEYKPEFSSKEEFLQFVDNLNSSGDRLLYNDNGDVVTVNI